jgi:hypothetical protein
VKDDGVVDDELSVGTKFFRNSILVRIALGFHFVEINLKRLKGTFSYLIDIISNLYTKYSLELHVLTIN